MSIYNKMNNVMEKPKKKHKIVIYDEKSVTVLPDTKTVGQNCSCENLFCEKSSKETQWQLTSLIMNGETQVEPGKCCCCGGGHYPEPEKHIHTCTCAAQCSLTEEEKANRINVGTIHSNALKTTQNIAVQYEQQRRYNYKDQTTNRATADRCLGNDNSVLTCSGSLTSCTCSEYTDSSTYSRVTLDYAFEKPKKTRQFRVKVITKRNQSTTTEKKNLIDVSTTTTDWWSPIVERKKNVMVMRRTGDDVMNKKKEMKNQEAGDELSDMKKKKETRMQEPGDKLNEILKKKKEINKQEAGDKMSEEVTTDGKYVSFKSCAQIIPLRNADIMSPSRYLLESQKYYNELFCSGLLSPKKHLRSQAQKLTEADKSLSILGVNTRTRKGCKTKRLEESYSPRKKTQTSPINLCPAKWRPAVKEELSAHALGHYHRYRNAKLQANLKSRTKHDKNIDKDTNRNKRVEVYRSFATKNDDNESVTGHCNSTSSY